MGGYHRRVSPPSMPTSISSLRSGPSPTPSRAALPRRLFGAAALLCVGVALSACASSGSSSGSSSRGGNFEPGSVTYANAARGSSLSLISESMLAEMDIPGDTPEERTLNFNSKKRSSAAVKVCSDDILKGVVQLFESEGFDKYATEGVANLEDRTSDGVLQVKFNGVERFLLNSDSTETDPLAKVAFANILSKFAQVYGEVRQYQAVDGEVEFKKPEISQRLRGQSQGSGLLPGSIR